MTQKSQSFSFFGSSPPPSAFSPSLQGSWVCLWCTDFPCLRLLIFPCCGFLGAFLNCELVDSSRLEQGSQSNCLVFPPWMWTDRVQLVCMWSLNSRACWYYHSRMLTAHFHVKTSSLKSSLLTIPTAAFLAMLTQVPWGEIYGCLCPFSSFRLLLILI